MLINKVINCELFILFFNCRLLCSIVTGHFTSVVCGVEIFKKYKMYHHLKYLGGKMKTIHGNLFGLVYQRKLRLAENY